MSNINDINLNIIQKNIIQKNIIKTVVSFIILEEGEFLYDEKTLNVYNCIPPHKHIGKINIKDFILIVNKK